LNKEKFNLLLTHEIQQMCQIALMEDLAQTDDFARENNIDVTAELIAKDKQATATLITRETGILCGVAWVEKIFELLAKESQDTKVNIDWNFKDADQVQANDVICTLSGNARDLLTGERSAMNFLQTLSATATLTSIYADIIKNSDCQLLDTRKTIPGMRFGQKYAVSCGGGTNHRIGLSDAFLIKENHIMACGGIISALESAITNHPDKLLEIEVESLDELKLALEGKAQQIMLDNFSLGDMREAKLMRDEHQNQAKLEASGNVSLETIADIAATGLDYISVGALTKNVAALDLSLRINLTT